MTKPYVRRVLLLAVAAIVAAVSHVVCHRLGCGQKHACAATKRSGWHDAAWLVGKLKLTPGQQAEFARFEADYRVTLEAACAKHRQLQTQLDGVLFGYGAAHAKTGALLAEMSRAQLAADNATVRHIREIDALLAPAQQAVFRALVSSCLCGNCPAKGKP